MVEQLFGSKTRVKLLQLFYTNPNRAYYVREITRKIDEQINSVRRELANLLSIGIISSDTTNNRLYYEVNQNFEHYSALASIFGGVKISKKTTIKDVDEVDIKTLGNIELAFYTGQFTRDETSGVDMVIVGDVNQTQLNNFIDDLEKRENKDLRYVLMSPKEFSYRRQINDRFIGLALGSKKQIIIDKQRLIDEK